MLNQRAGFTLIELLVVVLLVGILAAFGVPSYVRSLEVSKADDAVALTNMIGTTNRMFALDHANTYVVGQFPTAAATGCGTAACPAAGPYNNACALVWCRYLADQDFGSKPYNFFACNANVAGDCGGNGASGNFSGGSHRKNTAGAPYSSWGYTQNSQGVIAPHGSAPTPTY